MNKSFSQLTAQIEKLQKEAQAIKAKELDGVVARIKEAITRYGLTAADLGLTRSGKTRSKPVAKIAVSKTRQRGTRKSTGVAKFRGPEGQTWTGHGRAPNWFKAAIASGATQESLLVK
jgi:DNA-binding protein H-NS